jgi:hypothetical protein
VSINDVETMYLYTEKATRLIYEVQFVDDYCLVRPVDPLFHLAVKKMDVSELANDFDEYQGNWEEIRLFFRGNDSTAVLIN